MPSSFTQRVCFSRQSWVVSSFLLRNSNRRGSALTSLSSVLSSPSKVLYSGDFFAFVSEALNMRNAYGIYRSLSKYVEWADAKKAGTHRDSSIDEDFRSGVYLGNGLISMILGLLPGKVLKIMEVIGYTGDTEWGLKTLARAGGWSSDPKKLEPKMPIADEGIFLIKFQSRYKYEITDFTFLWLFPSCLAV